MLRSNKRRRKRTDDDHD